MKKILMCFLVTVFIFIFASCGNNSSDSNTYTIEDLASMSEVTLPVGKTITVTGPLDNGSGFILEQDDFQLIVQFPVDEPNAYILLDNGDEVTVSGQLSKPDEGRYYLLDNAKLESPEITNIVYRNNVAEIVSSYMSGLDNPRYTKTEGIVESVISADDFLATYPISTWLMGDVNEEDIERYNYIYKIDDDNLDNPTSLYIASPFNSASPGDKIAVNVSSYNSYNVIPYTDWNDIPSIPLFTLTSDFYVFEK